MKMCEEMNKLRVYLTSKGIKWEDMSDDDSDPCQIHRTKFDHNSNRISVIYGYGTIGGYYRTNNDVGLLEMRINDDEPEGRLTAEKVCQKLSIEITDEMTDAYHIKRLIDILNTITADQIHETDGDDSEYLYYVSWDDEQKEELEYLCSLVFITEDGTPNHPNIIKARTMDPTIDVVRGDGDSFGWLTGVITDNCRETLYYCFG